MIPLKRANIKPSPIRGAVLVTGASSGIGNACAFKLDKVDFQVFAGVRNAEDGQALRTSRGATGS